jgi:hypothetical protein
MVYLEPGRGSGIVKPCRPDGDKGDMDRGRKDTVARRYGADAGERDGRAALELFLFGGDNAGVNRINLYEVFPRRDLGSLSDEVWDAYREAFIDVVADGLSLARYLMPPDPRAVTLRLRGFPVRRAAREAVRTGQGASAVPVEA